MLLLVFVLYVLVHIDIIRIIYFVSSINIGVSIIEYVSWFVFYISIIICVWFVCYSCDYDYVCY